MTTNEIWHGRSELLVPNITQPVNMICADPPYGMDFQSNQGVLPSNEAFTQKIDGDDDPEQAVMDFHGIMMGLIPKLADQGEIYIFTAWHVLDWWIPAVKNLDLWLLCKCGHSKAHHRVSDPASKGAVMCDGDPLCTCITGRDKIKDSIELKMMLIWEKGDPGMGDLISWGCGYEIILYLKRGRKPLNGKRRPGIIHVDKVPPGKNTHPSEKPVELIRILIEKSTDPGDWVVDPYSGSGSTAVAAQTTGRNSIGIEGFEPYVESSRKRLMQQGFAFD